MSKKSDKLTTMPAVPKQTVGERQQLCADTLYLHNRLTSKEHDRVNERIRKGVVKLRAALAKKECRTLYELEDGEVHTILAALRVYQKAVANGSVPVEIRVIADNDGDMEPFDAGDIEVLCQKINLGG